MTSRRLVDDAADADGAVTDAVSLGGRESKDGHLAPEPSLLSRVGSSPISTHLDLIARKLDDLNRRHLAAGGRAALQAEDFTWRERALDLHHRVGLLWLEAENGERPSMDHVLSVGAACLAFALALDAAEVLDPASGEAA